MKHWLTVSLFSLALTSLNPLVANAASIVFKGPLTGDQEVPPKTTPAMGSYDATLDGDPNNWTFNYQVSFSDLQGLLQAGHIHFGDRGENGPVVHGLDNLPVGTTSSTIIGDWASSELPAGVAPDLVYQRFVDGLYYFNLHSTVFPGGEIRGQIESVPEPASLMGLALVGGAGMLLRRRQQVVK